MFDPDCIYFLGAYAGLAASNGLVNEASSDLRMAMEAPQYAAPESMFVTISAARILLLDEQERVCRLVSEAARTERTTSHSQRGT